MPSKQAHSILEGIALLILMSLMIYMLSLLGHVV
jgi:hypothetical protein